MARENRPLTTARPSIIARLTAFFFDYFLLFGALVLPQAALVALTAGFPFNRLRNGWQIESWVLLSVSLPTWLYFTISESSRHRATLGKRVFGLQVANVTGEGVSLRQALIRTAFKLLPWEVTHLSLLLPEPMWSDPEPGFRPGLLIAYLLMGLYLVVAWRKPQRRAPHDLVAGTIVVGEEKKSESGEEV